MKARNTLLISAAAMGWMALAGCHHDDGGAPAPAPTPSPPPAAKDLNTAAVLNIVQTMTSETATPFEVDSSATSGGVVVTPVGDETSPPMAVDAAT
jgi:hypothetical protein